MKRLPSTESPRAGFTLFEVLMALALSAMLLVAVLAALDLAIRMSVATPRSLQSAERSAALLRTLAADLRQLEPSDAAAAMELRERSMQKGERGDWDGLMGGETWIAGRIAIAAAAPSRLRDGKPPAAPDSSALWFIYAGPESRRATFLLSDAPRCLARIASSQAASGGITRLAACEREAGHRSSRADERRDDICEVLASDLRCRFRYYDGATWHMEWNSRVRRTLPHAVEITLLPADAPCRDAGSSAEVPNDRLSRIVVSLADRTSPNDSGARPARPFAEGRRR